jgi:hypothetical protein
MTAVYSQFGESPTIKGQKKYSIGMGKREAIVGSQHGHLRE